MQQNPKAAAQLAVDKKYLASTVELNTVAIGRLKYIPSVLIAEQTLYTAAKEMREAKMLSPTTDTDALAKRAFQHLEESPTNGSRPSKWKKSPEVRSTPTKIYGSTPNCSRKIPKIHAAEESFSILAYVLALIGSHHVHHRRKCRPGIFLKYNMLSIHINLQSVFFLDVKSFWPSSMGITTLPNSSTFLTIPVDFIFFSLSSYKIRQFSDKFILPIIEIKVNLTKKYFPFFLIC